MTPHVDTRAKIERFAIKPDSMAQSVILLLGLTLIQRSVGFGRSILLCRWLAPQELGHWDLTLAFLDMAAPVMVLSLPACFGRYVEHYRQKGQLRSLIARVTTAVLGMGLCSATFIYVERSWFANLLYSGDEEGIYLVKLLLFVLPALIVFNVLSDLFSGLRMFRTITMLQFAQSLGFAALALCLAALWRPKAESVIAGYGLTCALCSVVPLYWLIRMWRILPSTTSPLPTTAFWGRLLPFAGAVWMSNLLGNLFAMADRYMILHFSGMDATAAAAAVGQYHSARLVPLLLMQLSGIVGGMFVPYFSSDWEGGRRHVVRARLDLFLKLIGVILIVTAVAILLLSPLLFDDVFAGKFAQGKAILPWTLLCAVWFSIFSIARSYLWCDERVWLVNLGLVIALGVNAGANLVLLPRWGIQGAAISAALGTLALLLITYRLATQRGMPLSAGTWIVSAVPVSICLGRWLALAALAALVVALITTTWIFDPGEKEQLASFGRDYLDRWRSLTAGRRASPEASAAMPRTISLEETT